MFDRIYSQLVPNLLRNISDSGGATGYAGYAPAYPAIPSSICICIHIKKHIHVCVVYPSSIP
jgi:hypothetical protein